MPLATVDPFSLTLSKRGTHFKRRNPLRNTEMKVGKKTDTYRLGLSVYSKLKGGGFFGEGVFFVAGAFGGVFDY